MQQFYSTLSTDNPDITISQALRTAQQRMIDGEMSSEAISSTQGRNVAVQLTEQTIPRQANYAHPYYWAPFVIIGNGL